MLEANLSMHKPEYLYHGARRKHEILEPSQGIGPGEIDNEFGVYAVSKLEWAILFAFTFYPIGKGALFSMDPLKNPPEIILEKTEVDWNQIGYVYKVKSDTFEPLDSTQWLSKVVVKPVEVICIDPNDYQQWITYT
jgi:hypothetical protein